MSTRPIAYRGSDPYVFISYAHADSQRVYPLIQGIQNRNFRVWYDEGLEVGSHWDEAISEHLDKCHCVVCFVTEAFLKSENCLDEIHFAKELNKEPMIVYLDDITPPITFQFRYGRLHALRRSQSSSDDALLDELSRSEALQHCRGSVPAAGNNGHDTKIDPIVSETISTMSPASFYSSARRLHQQGNLALAFNQYRQAANMGHAEAQFYLGHCYFCGEGTDVNYAQAANWFHKALANGCEDAIDALEELYQENGYCSDDEEGIAVWYKDAAAAGDHRAQGAYAMYLWNNALGDRVPGPDQTLRWKRYLEQCTESLQWLEKALLGDARIEDALRLARCYELGTLVPRNFTKALQFYRLAAQYTEDPDAKQHLTNFLLRRSLTTTAEECYQRARSYVAGGYTNVDLEEAAAWYQRAVDRGHGASMRELGIIHYTYLGPNLPKNFNLAQRYLTDALKASKEQDAETMYAMAQFLKTTYYEKLDAEGLNKGRMWCQRAADLGHAEAQANLKYYQ